MYCRLFSKNKNWEVTLLGCRHFGHVITCVDKMSAASNIADDDLSGHVGRNKPPEKPCRACMDFKSWAKMQGTFGKKKQKQVDLVPFISDVTLDLDLPVMACQLMSTKGNAKVSARHFVIFTVRKRSLVQGNVFTLDCLSTWGEVL